MADKVTTTISNLQSSLDRMLQANLSPAMADSLTNNLDKLRSAVGSVPVSVQIIVAAVVFFFLSFAYSTLTSERPWPGFPIVALSEKGLSPLKSWIYHGRELTAKGMEQHKGPFQVITTTGPKLIIPNRFADEIRNNESLGFNEAFAGDLFPDYPGFDAIKAGLHDDALIQETVRVKLTQSLGLVTEALVDETTASIHDGFGESKEWRSITLKADVLHMVARLSSRVFLGKPLCRNERWLQIAKDYTMDVFIGAQFLRLVPAFFRPVAHWFLPHCRACRREVRDATKLITPEIKIRRARAEKALAEGRKPPKTADTIGWMVEIARGRKVNYVGSQLSLTFAAVHTTTEAITQAILDICAHPELVQPLREEVISVIGQEGWSKTALYKMKLMDSFLKESSRMSPGAFASMNRYVKSKVTLSDGTVLPAGSRLMVAPRYFDPTIFADPKTFDAARFMKMREQPGQANTWQHVTTSPAHLTFGHGMHACPGRFFASNEIKIAFAHLLLKYDWQAPEIDNFPKIEFESNLSSNPEAKVQLRRRKEEIDLDITLSDDAA